MTVINLIKLKILYLIVSILPIFPLYYFYIYIYLFIIRYIYF